MTRNLVKSFLSIRRNENQIKETGWRAYERRNLQSIKVYQGTKWTWQISSEIIIRKVPDEENKSSYVSWKTKICKQ